MKASSMIKFFILLVPLSLSFQSVGQYKYEKEERIKTSEVPSAALDYVSLFAFQKEPKWYLETGYNKTSIEAKGKLNQQFLSIEFSREGEFEDLEIYISLEDIPELTRQVIIEYLTRLHEKFKFRKLQVQYTGSEKAVLEMVKEKQPSDALITNYELVISTKVDGVFKKMEYLFGQKGSEISHSEIVLKMSDNIEY